MLRLRGVLVLLACVVSLGWRAAGAATPERAAFDVELTGTLTKDWTVRRTVEGECTEVTTHAGQWRMSLGSRRHPRLAFTSRGRGQAARDLPVPGARDRWKRDPGRLHASRHRRPRLCRLDP